MPHSQAQAQKWISLLLAQDLPFVDILSRQIAVGRIGELCECGCHGFAFDIPAGANVLPLQEGKGLFYELVFASNLAEVLDLLLFTDERGYLSCVDVTFGLCNAESMPQGITPGQLLHAWPAMPE